LESATVASDTGLQTEDQIYSAVDRAHIDRSRPEKVGLSHLLSKTTFVDTVHHGPYELTPEAKRNVDIGSTGGVNDMFNEEIWNDRQQTFVNDKQPHWLDNLFHIVVIVLQCCQRQRSNKQHCQQQHTAHRCVQQQRTNTGCWQQQPRRHHHQVQVLTSSL
jgi:hypothetical protein